MKIYKIMVPFSDCGEIPICDGIEHEGGIWLVPTWLDNPATGMRTPIRIVRVDKLPLQPAILFLVCDYAVPVLTLSKAVLEGRAPPRPPIEVVESPNIEFPIPRTFH